MKKTLLNILLGASLMFGAVDKTKAQNTDSLDIKIYEEKNNQIIGRGYIDKKVVAFINCNNYEEGNYTNRCIHWGQNNLIEFFNIDYENGLVDYRMYTLNPYKEVINLKNLTKEQIFQDKKFAERTKRVIKSCESKDKLREMIKEIYKESEELESIK